MWFNSHKFYNLANTTMLVLVYPPAYVWDEFLDLTGALIVLMCYYSI